MHTNSCENCCIQGGSWGHSSTQSLRMFKTGDSYLEIVPPQRADLIAAPHVPACESDGPEHNGLHVEADGGDGGNHLPQLEPVQDGRLPWGGGGTRTMALPHCLIRLRIVRAKSGGGAHPPRPGRSSGSASPVRPGDVTAPTPPPQAPAQPQPHASNPSPA